MTANYLEEEVKNTNSTLIGSWNRFFLLFPFLSISIKKILTSFSWRIIRFLFFFDAQKEKEQSVAQNEMIWIVVDEQVEFNIENLINFNKLL
jgi:hypothetical protein